MNVLKRYRPADERRLRDSRALMLGSERIRLGLTTDALHLAYQPKVDLIDGALIGVEALLRWRRYRAIAGLLGNTLPIYI
jgi:sensor c-di-GMP phosphodiesterase-like protein